MSNRDTEIESDLCLLDTESLNLLGGMVGQVLDEFHPGDPDHEEVESHESVEAYIRKLQAEYDDFITSPRQFNLKRITCLAHTLQLPILKMFEDEEGVFYDVLKKVNSEKF